MIVVRQVFQAKYGRGDELVALFHEFNRRVRDESAGGAVIPQFRILTDASGPFFTVVNEVEVENLSAWETRFGEAMMQPWMDEWFSRMVPLVDSGSREFYTLVEEPPR
jgi:hypothetical protein